MILSFFNIQTVIPLLRGNAEIRGFEGSAEIRRSEKKNQRKIFSKEKKFPRKNNFCLEKNFSGKNIG